MSAGRPRPIPDLQTEPYWQGLRRRALLVQLCEVCSVHVHPLLPCCPVCLETDLSWVQIEGAGLIVGHCTVAQPFVPGIVTPYVVIRVSLLAAPEVELIANMLGGDEPTPAIGSPVHVVYDVVDDDLVLAQFELTPSAA
jgi:uncharacterized protein